MIKKYEELAKEFVYDFAKDGGAVSTISMKAVDPNGDLLPEGFVVTDIMLKTETTITSGGTPTITFGNTSDVDGYFVDVFALAATAGAMVRVGQVDGALMWDSTADAKKAYLVSSVANTQDLVMAIGTAALTAGKIRIIVKGYFPGTAQRA